MSSVKALRNPATNQIDCINQLGTILAVFAHPDDETWIAGGLLCMAVENGQKVICVTATKGEAGVQDEKRWPVNTLGQTREQELKAALNVLGITTHEWLDYHDGHCHQVPDEDAVAEINKLIETYQPDTIITFAPDGLTGHQDHQAVSRWSKLAVAKTKKPIQIYYGVDSQEQYDEFLKLADEKFNIYFKIKHPNLIPKNKTDICLELPKETLDKKIASLRAMPSQTARMFEEDDGEWMHDAFLIESFVRAERDDLKWIFP